MILNLQRLRESSECIIGSLSADGATQCFTLELPLSFDGNENVPDKTCIPAATYRLERLYSQHFQRMMPHVIDVPGRSNVEVHWGNKAKDILGCILVGEDCLSDTMIGNSKEAFDDLDRLLDNAWANGEQVFITIKNISFVV